MYPKIKIFFKHIFSFLLPKLNQDDFNFSQKSQNIEKVFNNLKTPLYLINLRFITIIFDELEKQRDKMDDNETITLNEYKTLFLELNGRSISLISEEIFQELSIMKNMLEYSGFVSAFNKIILYFFEYTENSADIWYLFISFAVEMDIYNMKLILEKGKNKKFN